MLPQFKAMERPSAALVEQGIFLILSGLFKKVVIADRLNIYVNTIFEGPSLYPSLACILAALLFTVQLYCDFAGVLKLPSALRTFLDSLQVPYYLTEETAKKMPKGSISENVTVVPFNSADPKFFLDYIHLSSDGRREYSKSLMAALR